MKSKLELIPEYESSGVLICPPSHCLVDRKDIDQDYKDTFQGISKVIPVLDLSHTGITYPDLWARDFSPIPAKDRNGNPILVSFRYKPHYIPKSEIDYIQLGNSFGAKLAEHIGSNIWNVGIILDGGNICQNGKICILTERILEDNPHLNQRNLEEIFRSLGIEKLILIPVEPGDVTGHTDGTIRFIDSHTIAIAEYPPSQKALNEYLFEIQRKIYLEADKNLIFLPINNDDPEDDFCEGLPSCVGNYLNFIQTKSHILLPKYKKSNSSMIEDNRNSLSKTGKKVLVIDTEIDRIAKYGGSLNCLTGSLQDG